ncbi:MAG: hypothetical protein ACJA01_001140, partial [Saprospiraceae bacterium]
RNIQGGLNTLISHLEKATFFHAQDLDIPEVTYLL